MIELQTKLRHIKANYEKPMKINKDILYPQYVALVKVEIPRIIGQPRIIRSYVMVDGGTGKVVRCNDWPTFESKTDVSEVIETIVSETVAKKNIEAYALKRLARKYLTYWKPTVTIERFDTTYKLFWLTDPVTAVDSISNRKLSFQ